MSGFDLGWSAHNWPSAGGAFSWGFCVEVITRGAIVKARGEDLSVTRRGQLIVDSDHRLVMGSYTKKVVDIGEIATEARKVADEHECNLPALDQMSDLAEPLARAGMGAAYSEVVSDDLHARGRPTPLPGLVSQAALELH